MSLILTHKHRRTYTHRHTHTESLSRLYISQIQEYVCRYVNLEVFVLHGCTGNSSPPQNALQLWCLPVDTHTQCFSLPPSLSPSSLSLSTSLSLSLYTYPHSAGREHMYLRNVRPLKFTVKAATPPTASPKGFQEHMFLTSLFSEAFELQEGTGCNLGVQVPPKALLYFSFLGGGEGDRFSLSLRVFPSFSLTPSKNSHDSY